MADRSNKVSGRDDETRNVTIVFDVPTLNKLKALSKANHGLGVGWFIKSAVRDYIEALEFINGGAISEECPVVLTMKNRKVAQDEHLDYFTTEKKPK